MTLSLPEWMDDMGHLEWAAVIPLRMLDTAVVLEVEKAEVAAGLVHLLAPFVVAESQMLDEATTIRIVDGSRSGADGAGLCLAVESGDVIVRSASWSGAVGALITTLNRRVIDEYSGFAVHAGVVATDGRAVAFPADSGGGKTTLTAACLLAGFDYVSDESLCVDVATLAVVRYPKPMGISPWSRRRLNQDAIGLAFPAEGIEAMLAPADLGAAIAPQRIGLKHVVRTRYGAGRLALTEAPSYEAMAALLEFSFNHFKHGEKAFTVASGLANNVRVWRLEYDDPIAAAELLRARLG